MAEALYRKYRPQIFEDVVGQDHIERTLKNALSQDKVSHAYLFTGPRGTGKTTTARLLAKALLCQKGPTPEPDGTCEDCVLIANGEHPDVYELDAASRTGVENVREEIIGRVQFAPTRGRYKVYIIDEVHMLSTAAFNALLKTLEEPPSHVVFILCTTDPQKVPETIHSRCQRFDFRRISSDEIVSRLGAVCVAEDVEFEGEALDLIAHRAEGGMRNALTTLEQLIAFGEGKVTLEGAERMLGSLDSSELAEIVKFIGTRDVASCFRWTAEYVETGADLAQFTRDMAEHMRNMYVMSLAGTDVALDVSEPTRRELAQELSMFGPDRLARMLSVLGDLSAELRTSTNPRLSFEIALTRMVRPESDLTLESLAERLEALERDREVRREAAAHETYVTPATPTSHVERAESAELPMQDGSAQVASGYVPVQAVSQNTSREVPVQTASRQAPMPATPQTVPQDMPREIPQNVSQQIPVQSAPRDAFPGVMRESAVPRSQEPTGSPQAASSPSLDNPACSLGGLASFRNPAAFHRAWKSAMATNKKCNAAYGVLFLSTKVTIDENATVLNIDFPAENTFAFKAVQKPDVQEALKVALAQACGREVPFRIEQAASAVQAVPAATAAAPRESAEVRGAREVIEAYASQAKSSLSPAAPAATAQPMAAVPNRPSAPRPTPQPVAGPEPAVPFADDSFDEVPIDIYDSYAVLDDDDFEPPIEPMLNAPQAPAAAVPASNKPPVSASAAPTPNAVSAAEPMSSTAVPSAMPASSAVPTAQPAPLTTVPDDQSAETDSEASDLDAILSFGFGEDVKFEPVD